ncbi:MAG: hypothetical protein HC853_17945 [Anaerolineae bacterium]|nr:hypothetical protein [Anaerolineae bacterium]
MITLTAGALNSANFLATNLVVNKARMAANVVASNGLMLAERLSLALTPVLGREPAKQALREACEIALREDKNVLDVLQARTDANVYWDALRDERSYLGAALAFY